MTSVNQHAFAVLCAVLCCAMLCYATLLQLVAYSSVSGTQFVAHAAGVCHFFLCVPLADWAGSGVLYFGLPLQPNDCQGDSVT